MMFMIVEVYFMHIVGKNLGYCAIHCAGLRKATGAGLIEQIIHLLTCMHF